MRTLNLSGFKPADSLSISVSQNAITAGPITVSSWGGGGGGGTIAVNAIHRSLRQMAPDSVRFEVDLSSSSFDTPGPSGTATYYDPRLHDLIYLWDMGDPGTWTAPINVLTAWKNRNVSKGPSVRHVYRDPGDYTVSVLVIEPSTGKTATAETTVTVSDPQDFYGDANTIYINNVGDSDFSDVPAGVPSGNKINIDTLQKLVDGNYRVPDATWAAFEGGHAKRWRFKRGGEWDVSVYIDYDDSPHIMFDDYGDAGDPDPILNPLDPTDALKRQIFQVGGAHEDAGDLDVGGPAPEFRFRNIDFRADFNAVTTNGDAGNRTTFFRNQGACNLVAVDCSFNGFANSVVYSQTGNGNTSHDHKLHLDNCILGNFGGQYPIMWVGSYGVETSVCLTGLRAANPGDARCGAGNVGCHSILRGDGMFTHIQGCDVFHTDETQPGLTPCKTPRLDGFLVNIHSCGIEGGSDGISIGGNYGSTPDKRSYTGNIIVDGLVYVGNWESSTAVSTNATGATIRNVLSICPAAPRLSNACRGLVETFPLWWLDPYVTIPDFVLDAPIKTYNCTLRMDRIMAQNSSGNDFVPTLYSTEKPYDGGSVAQPFTAVSESNNVLHFPNLIAWPNTVTVNPEHIAFAPLSETVLWTARCQGRRDPVTGVLDTQYAVPAGAVMDTKPLPGSAALGAALSGNVSYMDILGTTRTAPADKGAWEVA